MTIAALVEFPDGREQVVSLDQLGDMSARALAGACVRLVTRCACCGSWQDRTTTYMQGGDRGKR